MTALKFETIGAAGRGLASVTIMILAGALTACAAPPASRDLPSIGTDYASAEAFAAPAGEWPEESWWSAYGDPQLDALIAEALAGSPTVAVADARLRRARSLADVAHSATRPQVSNSSSATLQRQSYNMGSPAQQGWNDYGRNTLDFSWELDFWGKNRAALAAATSEANAAAAELAQARLALAAAIASAYAELAREHAARDTAVAALQVRTKSADLFRRRYDNGLETLGSVRGVESRRASAEVDVLALDEQLALQRNRIAALLGAGPDRGLSITRPTIDLSRTYALPENLGAELLGRRPDIAAARMRAEASGSRIRQARAAFYPNVNLAAFVGVQSFGLDMLTKDGSSIGSVGPAISLPIFDGGRLRGQLRGAEADYMEAVASYDRTVVQALQDVADAATSQKALGAQVARAGEAVDAAREAWRIENQRYEGGLANYLDVLSAEDSLLASLRTQSDLNSRAFELDVALVRALGGGYSVGHPGTVASR